MVYLYVIILLVIHSYQRKFLIFIDIKQKKCFYFFVLEIIKSTNVCIFTDGEKVTISKSFSLIAGTIEHPCSWQGKTQQCS